MRSTIRLLATIVSGSLALAGCSSKEESSAPAPAAQSAGKPQTTDTPAAPITTAVMSDARNSLKSGNVDEAAARLAQLQMQQAAFNAQQAKDYRQLLSDAYDRAIEAAQRGDPRGEAAIKLLRAAAPR